MPNNGVTSGTPTKILFGAGVYFHGVKYDEKVAPTSEEIKAAVFGATQEGGTLTITPEFFTPELDGVHVAVKELQRKIGETAQMEVSFAELTADYMHGKTAHAVYTGSAGQTRLCTGCAGVRGGEALLRSGDRAASGGVYRCRRRQRAFRHREGV